MPRRRARDLRWTINPVIAGLRFSNGFSCSDRRGRLGRSSKDFRWGKERRRRARSRKLGGAGFGGAARGQVRHSSRAFCGARTASVSALVERLPFVSLPDVFWRPPEPASARVSDLLRFYEVRANRRRVLGTECECGSRRNGVMTSGHRRGPRRRVAGLEAVLEEWRGVRQVEERLGAAEHFGDAAVGQRAAEDEAGDDACRRAGARRRSAGSRPARVGEGSRRRRP